MEGEPPRCIAKSAPHLAIGHPLPVRSRGRKNYATKNLFIMFQALH